MFGRDAPGFDELEIDWGPDEPFGPDDDPGTPMTHQDSSESDELRPDLFEPGAAPLPAPDVYAPEPPTRAPTPAPEPAVPATWLDLMRSLQADGASPYPLPPRARRPPR